MKVGLVHLNLAVESGDPRMFYSIAQNLKKLGHEVFVYTARFDPACYPELHRGLAVTVAPAERSPGQHEALQGFREAVSARLARSRFQEDAVIRISEILRDDLDALICQNDYSYELGTPYKRAHPAAVVVWVMNNPPFYWERKRNLLMTIGSRMAAFMEERRVRRALQGIDLIVVHDEARKRVAEKLGKPVLLLHIPVDFEQFFEPAKTRARGDKTVLLLGVGSLSPTRKYEDIIRGAHELRKRGYDARVLLVCKDAWRNARQRAFLERLVREIDMSGHVEFRFDGASETELRAARKKADFFVFPNHINIWSMASCEAMAAGVPLLVSRATSVAELLKDGEEAMLFSPGDIRQLADRAEALLSDPVMYARVAVAGQRFVRERLNWDLYARRLTENLEKSRLRTVSS